MFEKCIDCDRIGKDCIPNLYVMSVEEIRDWTRKRKNYLGWSNSILSEVSGVPKGTIDCNFSKRPKKCHDVNYSTFAPVLCALIGSEIKEPCCRSQECDTVYLRQTEEENRNMKKTIAHAEQKISEYNARIEYLKDGLRWRRKLVIFLLFISFIQLVIILAELCIDWQYRDLGFFWR